MAAESLLASLHARGLRVESADGALKVGPARLLTDEDRSTIVVHKADLLVLLEQGHSSLAIDAQDMNRCSSFPREHLDEHLSQMALPPVHDAASFEEPVPVLPCALCGGRRWRLWSDDLEAAVPHWRRYCCACSPLVVHNTDGSLWRDSALLDEPIGGEL